MGQYAMTLRRRRSPPLSLSYQPDDLPLHSLFTSSELRGERTVDPPSLQFTVSHSTRAVGNWGIGEWGITKQTHGTQQATSRDLDRRRNALILMSFPY